jgi:tetratricopeptide (TPR) repeat protein
MNEEEKKSESLKYKEKGNQEFKNEKYEESIEYYKKAIELYDKDPVYFSNISLSYFHLENYKESAVYSNKSLELKKTIKGYQIYIKSLIKMREYKNCLDLITQAGSLFPKEKCFIDLSKELNKQILNNQKEMKKYELPDKFSFIEFNKIKNLQERDEIKKILVNQFKKHYEENNKIPIREKNLENYHYSKKELEELELLDLSKMNREINKNKFILCQIISKPIFAVQCYL